MNVRERISQEQYQARTFPTVIIQIIRTFSQSDYSILLLFYALLFKNGPGKKAPAPQILPPTKLPQGKLSPRKSLFIVDIQL